ncbi:TPR repeat-containing protein [Candidatus Terasakiella magnetica]|nr:TPR repeat-containing protein [Candidatus Terasakiella magnetica]
MQFRPLVRGIVGLSLLTSPALAGLDEGIGAYQRRDWNTAATELRPVAAQGNSKAQARLGHIFLFGLTGPGNESEGLRLLNAAAAASEPMGQHWLAMAYYLGRGLPKDPATALVWLGRAAEKDYPESLHALGEMYFYGSGIGKDEAKGIEFLRRAADLGVPASQERLADLNWSGRGMPTNRAKAVEYARKAADAGLPHSQVIVGVAFWTGEGATKDITQGLQWFRRAADQGDAVGQHNLSEAYRTGLGLQKDPGQAYFWLVLAASRANAAIKAKYEKDRDDAAAALPPGEADKIRQRTAQWQPKPERAGTVALRPTQPPAQVTATPPVYTQSGPPSQPAAPEQVIKPGRSMSGSGFLVSRDGVVLTNAHVIEQCRTITVKPLDGPPQVAVVSAKDSGNDLAVLRTSLRVGDVAKFRDDKALRPGDDVVVVGFPLSSLLSREANVTAGVISALNGIHGDARYYQLTAPVQKGNSGGPLADMNGNVVGVVSSKLNAMKIAGQTGDLPQNINFAIKAEVAREFLTTYGVKYETAPGGAPLSSADVGERIKRIAVFVECRIN